MAIKTMKGTIDEYVGYFKKIFDNGKPLARLLKTPSGYFLYDTGTNKIANCRLEVAELLYGFLNHDVNPAVESFISRHGENVFLDAGQEIIDAVEAENILRVKKASKFDLSDHFKDVEAILDTSIHSITLEILQDCNLRCDYCIYHRQFKGKRDFGRKSMSLETAKKSIEFLKNHSSESDPVSVGFYGGEPLMRFPFIKECVAYAKEIFSGRNVLFNMTTNGTLITPDIAEYLMSNGFSILVSLDGPEQVHDDFRKYKNGKGSFKDTMRGLEILAEKHNEIKNGQISVNVVYTPPYSEEKIDRIDHFLAGIHSIPGLHVMMSYPQNGSIPEGRVSETEKIEDKNLTQWGFEKYRKGFDKSNQTTKGIIEKKFARLIQRPVLKEPVDSYSFNGCCLPGQRKNYITTEGDIQICEKMPTSCPAIGHVDTGFDIDVIKRVYIDDYAEKSMRYCSECWGIRLCDICYLSAFNENGELDIEMKSQKCLASLNLLEHWLGNFISLLEENPEGLDYLYEYELK